MKIEKIKPIPKYILNLIKKADKQDRLNQNSQKRFYAYLTTNDKELVKVTVAIKNKGKNWYCKQVAIHGVNSKDCFIKDIEYTWIAGYSVGWYEQGLQKFVDLTTRFINSGKQDSKSFEEGLKEAFGQDFPLLKDEKLFGEFKWHIKPLDTNPDRKTWLMQIFEDYCNTCPNAPKRTSVEFLNLSGFSQVEKEAAQKLADRSTIMKIFNITHTNNEYLEILGGNSATQAITNEILGGKESRGHLFNQLSKYLENKKINIDFARAKALICANFERRVKEGMFEPFGEEGIKAARDLLYNGTISTTFNNGHIANKQTYQNLINAIFNKEVFKTEEKAMPGILNIIEELKKIPSGTNFTEETLKANSLADQTKSFITRIYNNKTWMKIFAPMAIGLVAVTLLAQPFFGKIKKEFPENEKSGGTK